MTRPLPDRERTTRGLRSVLAGRYELQGLIGRGGMAEVHRAHDRALDRTVAVKLLPVERRADPEYAVRLRGEARAAASLLHPNAVSVFDVGDDGEDVFVVMEHVEGVTLRDELRSRGRLPAHEAAAVGAAVCAALAAAHDRGIVHRDVNPANVMRCTDGTVKLMDFGIARTDDTAGADRDGLTGSGVVIGTAAYLSPEQVRCEPLDGRADQYALGCSLYELVTGEVPFPGTGAVDVAARRLRERPVPPRSLVPSLPAAMDRAIVRALERDPDDRFPDVRMLAAELHGVTGGSAPGPAEPVTVPEPRHGPDPVGSTTDAAVIAPGAGDAEPWTAVRRAGLALVALGALALLVVGLLLLVP